MVSSSGKNADVRYSSSELYEHVELRPGTLLICLQGQRIRCPQAGPPEGVQSNSWQSSSLEGAADLSVRFGCSGIILSAFAVPRFVPSVSGDVHVIGKEGVASVGNRG